MSKKLLSDCSFMFITILKKKSMTRDLLALFKYSFSLISLLANSLINLFSKTDVNLLMNVF